MGRALYKSASLGSSFYTVFLYLVYFLPFFGKFLQRKCYYAYGDSIFCYRFPGRSATLDVESIVMLIIIPGRQCYIVCGEQKLYILLLMEECFSILVCYGLQRRNYGLYMCYFTHYTYLYIVMIFIIFKMCLKNI